MMFLEEAERLVRRPGLDDIEAFLDDHVNDVHPNERLGMDDECDGRTK
jgi:hypothetical protein